MSIVNTETGEILDTAAAERRAERISLRLDAIADNYAAVMPMIRDAIEKRDDRALGYRSPGEYVADRFGASLQRLGGDVNRVVVKELTEAGMSQRAIAPVIGVTQQQVSKYQKQVTTGLSPVSNPEPAFVSATEALAEITQTPVVAEEGEAEATTGPAPVVGIDGKTYNRPTVARATPRPEAERSLNVIALYAGKAAREAASLTPDQIRRIKPKADLWTVGLRDHVEALQRLLTSLEQEK